MPRDTGKLADLAKTVRWAYLAVNAAIPLPFETAGIVAAEPGLKAEHLMTLRESAFETVLGELLDNEYEATRDDLHALERGQAPAGLQDRRQGS